MANVSREGPSLRLRLYVAGDAPNSLRAVTNIRAICNEHFASAYELEVVDVLAHPLRALEDSIIVTPTLLKLSPPPVRKVVGDLRDSGSVVLALACKVEA